MKFQKQISIIQKKKMYKLEIPFKQNVSDKNKSRITSRILTKYEQCRLLSTRALQIANNSSIFTDIDKTTVNSLDIAKKEFREKKKFPLSIRRILPNGLVEDFDLDEMIIIDEM